MLTIFPKIISTANDSKYIYIYIRTYLFFSSLDTKLKIWEEKASRVDLPQYAIGIERTGDKVDLSRILT